MSMKNKEFIKILQSFDPEINIRIADWSERCQMPSPLEEDEISIEAHYIKSDGVFLKIGKDE